MSRENILYEKLELTEEDERILDKIWDDIAKVKKK